MYEAITDPEDTDFFSTLDHPPPRERIKENKMRETEGEFYPRTGNESLLAAKVTSR